MENLYGVNGLIFWTQEEIKLRRMFEERFSERLLLDLRMMNSAFEMIQVEAPQLTPVNFINPGYLEDDVFHVSNSLALRPETTMGSFTYAKFILSGHHKPKHKAPIVVFQHGKSFRKEQDQPTKFMRLKEFYQLEFQIIYSMNTANDYSLIIYKSVHKMIEALLGPCRLEYSDRIPTYSQETMDVICLKSDMEVCSISKRLDFYGYKIVEVAIGTDRCIYNFINK